MFSRPKGSRSHKGFYFRRPALRTLRGNSLWQKIKLDRDRAGTNEVALSRIKHIQTLYDRHISWQVVGRKIAEMQLIEKELREYQMLMLNAEERYAEFNKNFGHLLKRVALFEIASYLGITPVSLSQIRKTIQERKSKN